MAQNLQLSSMTCHFKIEIKQNLATIYTKDILLLGNILLEFVVGCEVLIKAT